MKTQPAKKEDVKREWLILDASDVTLGRLASTIAHILRGKHKPSYTPHLDTGDHVIVINADKIKITGGKRIAKRYYSHSDYPGGLKSKTMEQWMDKEPEWVVKQAVKGMLPRNTLGRGMLTKLRVYRDENHPHEAQQPRRIEFNPKRIELRIGS